MRFRPIRNCAREWGDFAIPEHIDNLIHDFYVTSCRPARDRQYKASAIERALVKNRVSTKDNDYGHLGYPPIDHAFFMKCEDGTIFLLTMPYGNAKSFHRDLSDQLEEYRDEKIAHGKLPDVNLATAVIDNKYKIRKNGNIVAIIATPEKLADMCLTETNSPGKQPPIQFEPIETLYEYKEYLTIPEHIDNVIHDFDAVAWCKLEYGDHKAPTIERLLKYGEAQKKPNDFGRIDWLRSATTIAVKRSDGRVFLLVMPNQDEKSFCEMLMDKAGAYLLPKYKLTDNSIMDTTTQILNERYKVFEEGNSIIMVSTNETFRAVCAKFIS